MSLAEFPIAPPDDDERAAGPDRLPPQDVAAEQCVLGSMLLSKDAIADVVELIHGADYYRPAHETVHDAILDLFGRGEPADAVTVAAELSKRHELNRIGGASYLHTLIASVPSAANAGYYAEIVREKAILRRLVGAGTKIIQLGYGGEGEVEQIVDAAQAEIYGVADKRDGEDYVPLHDVMEAALDEIEAASSRGGALVGIPTGFTDLDHVTTGLHPGQLIVVAARPGVGKALALDTPLPTSTGWTTMGDVKVGDELIGANGRPTKVLAATDVMRGRPCYEVEFSDGEIIVADAQHQWVTTTRAQRRAASARQPTTYYWPKGRVDDVVRRAKAAAAEPEQMVTTAELVAEVGDDFRSAIQICARLVHARGRAPRVVAVKPDAKSEPHAWSAPIYPRSRMLAALAQRVSRPAGSWAAAQFPQVVTTEEMAATLRRSTDQRLNHAVAVAAPFDLPPVDLPVPPYALGVWLGDGHSRCATFTSADPEIAEQIRAEGLRVQRRSGLVYSLQLPLPAPQPPPRCPDCGQRTSGCRRCRACNAHHTSLQAILRSIGVLNNKHIPPQYLRASIEQRRALLAGLLDTDGYITKAGLVQFAVTSRRLAFDVLELVHSLGYRTSLTTKSVAGHTEESSTSYCISFTPREPVFRLTRKLARQRGTVRADTRMVVDVRPVDSVPVRCVQVDADDHMYLAGRSCIPTHNSILALNLARSCSIANDMTSVLFSLEMGRTEITMRLLSAEAKVPLQHMRQGSMSNEDWQKLAAKMAEVSEAPLFIDDSPNLTMMEIRAKCRRLKQRNDLKLVLVDYLQLMTSGRRVESRQQEVAEFSRSLKLLAKELDVPVVALSQLNRGPEQRTDKKPMLSDLRESGAIEQDADVVILLHRDDAYERESTRPGEADFILAKHRNGPMTTVTTAFQGHYQRFVDMASG